jgi:cation diffusion facilitator family transporter
LIEPSIKRSRAGLRAVGVSLGVLGLTALIQALIFVATGSVALLADLIHNFGDAATAIPVGIAFLLRSERAERIAGLFVVAAIFLSACVAGYEAIVRVIDPSAPSNLGALAAAGAIGFGGNMIAAVIRTRAGHRLNSPALIADGAHARADAYVSLAVVLSAGIVAIGFELGDPLIALGITLVILRITWQSWVTIRDGHAASSALRQGQSRAYVVQQAGFPRVRQAETRPPRWDGTDPLSPARRSATGQPRARRRPRPPAPPP